MIKVGTVGTGGIAEWHASAFKDNKNSEDSSRQLSSDDE